MESRVVATKVANALIEDAEPNTDLIITELTDLIMPELKEIAAPLFNATMAEFAAYYGGLWVGGKIILTTHELKFQPNFVNKMAHKGLAGLQVSLSQVVSVEILPGVLTKIIVVRTPSHAIKFRCYGAEETAQKIQESLGSAARERNN
ncbi:hypothetical protein [Pseudarthrobacter sp. TAF60_1]|uniref:hypothetical protein n=1 Tax=Pseudarthrobacter sp. TAF60_1 TaxID=3233071 RepID=UPI003F99706A